MDGIGIVISPSERKVWRANRCWLETTENGPAQLAVAREEEVDPMSPSTETTKTVIARVQAWCYLQGLIELDSNGIAPACTISDFGWEFGPQKAEPEPKEPLEPSVFSRNAPPKAPPRSATKKED